MRGQRSRGGGTKSENTDQATGFVKVQSCNSQHYNLSLSFYPLLPLFVPHMETHMPAGFFSPIDRFYFNHYVTKYSHAHNQHKP